uniref:C3H1-type domain-containing protein n=1 Tax=Alexandrium monilatum TaxID=311494 RepID=A0A7S4R8J5_9DINO
MSAPRTMGTRALPTLLTSRPPLVLLGGGSVAKAPEKDVPQAALPEAYPMPLRVRNTFIDTSAERSPSLERFFQEREVATCPSAHIGRLRNLFQEAADGSRAGLAGRNIGQPEELPSRCGMLEAPAHEDAAAGNGRPPAVVLSLSQVLSSAVQAPQQYASGGRPAAPGSYVGCAAFPSEATRGGHGPQRGAFAPGHRVACAAAGGSLGGSEPPWLEVPAPPNRPALGSPELPTIGSAGHAVGRCKPCAFVYSVGCKDGVACQFCHLCEPGEKKRRRKEKLEARRAAHRQRQTGRKAASAPGVREAGFALSGCAEDSDA